MFLHRLHLILSLKPSHYFFGLGRVVLFCFPLPAVLVCLFDPAVQASRSRGLFGISILQLVPARRLLRLGPALVNPERDFFF